MNFTPCLGIEQQNRQGTRMLHVIAFWIVILILIFLIHKLIP